MYRVGKGHEHTGPGTSLVQFIDWTPADERQMCAGFGSGLAGMFPEFATDCGAVSRSCAERGIGCACGGAGKGCAGSCGLGLFDSGLNPAGWGPLEWGIVAIAGYMVVSTVFTTKRAVSRVRAIPGERRKAKAKRLRERAAELSRK